MLARSDPLSTDRVRILIVEDHEDTRDLMIQLLEAAGAVVTGAASAPTALATAAKERFDVVMTDVGLGHSTQDGVWLRQRFKDDERLADIPFVAMTGRKEREAELIAAGFAAVLIKPIEVDAVAAIVFGVARRYRPQ